MFKLSQSDEDYLESIMLLEKEIGKARVSDIALKLKVSKPSTSEKIKILSKNGFTEYKKYSSVELTKKGRRIAEKIYSKHELLRDFFQKLEVDKKTAVEDACKCEHILNKKTLSKIRQFLKKEGKKE